MASHRLETPRHAAPGGVPRQGRHRPRVGGEGRARSQGDHAVLPLPAGSAPEARQARGRRAAALPGHGCRGDRGPESLPGARRHPLRLRSGCAGPPELARHHGALRRRGPPARARQFGPAPAPPMSALPADVTEFIASARLGRLAPADGAGQPLVVPICYAWDGEALISAIDAKPKRAGDLKRVRNIRENPKVSVVIDLYDEDWRRLRWVIIQGLARSSQPGATSPPASISSCRNILSIA